MLDFRSLVNKHSTIITLHEETDGYYDYDDDGRWKARTKGKKVAAAVFNLSIKDINSSLQYNEGGTFTKNDIKIYLYKQLTIGSKVTFKNKQYAISAELDYGDRAGGLYIYIAKRAGGITNENLKK